MNCSAILELWDDRRDGTLDPARRDAFDEHLHRCPDCAAKWAEESRWLEELVVAPAPADPARFTRDVVARWQSGGGVLARIIGWSSLAAMFVIAASLLMAHMRRRAVVRPPGADPVGTLVVEMTRSIDRSPVIVTEAVRRAAAVLTSDPLSDVLENADLSRRSGPNEPPPPAHPVDRSRS